MNPGASLVSFYTMLRKDILRIFRIWPQTLLPSAVTAALYFLIFGAFLGGRIGDIAGVPYVNFVVPGLVMLGVVTNAFSNVATVFYSQKFLNRNIDEILVTPTPPWVFVSGFIAGGVARGVIVGVLVLIVSLLFADIRVHNLAVIVVFLVLTSLAFSLGGLVNGIYAKSFDAISIIPTFVLAPLVYLGGVFYPAHVLPPVWQAITHLNPIFYVINGFRYGFLGFSDVPIWLCLVVLIGLNLALGAVNMILVNRGLGLRQ